MLVGWKSIVLVDLKKGRLLGEHSLPCQPTDAVVIGDFDNDGWNDVILTCPVGYVHISTGANAPVPINTGLACTLSLKSCQPIYSIRTF